MAETVEQLKNKLTTRASWFHCSSAGMNKSEILFLMFWMFPYYSRFMFDLKINIYQWLPDTMHYADDTLLNMNS